jgi:hypothetical protein
MMSFRGQAIWAKIMSPWGKLTALACHLTQRVNKAEELTYLSTNIGHISKQKNPIQQNKNANSSPQTKQVG